MYDNDVRQFPWKTIKIWMIYPLVTKCNTRVHATKNIIHTTVKLRCPINIDNLNFLKKQGLLN